MKTLVAVVSWLSLCSFLVNYALALNLCRGSCSVDLETKGCYIDKGGAGRALPEYIYNERDPSIPNYGGRRIDWLNWNDYFPGFICRCAEKAKQLGFDLIGVQFYGECWAGHSGIHNYSQYGLDYSGCIEDDYQLCTKNSRYCVGKHFRNMVFQIVDTTCPGISFERVGCYKDAHKQTQRPLPDYLFNDRDSSIQTWSGKWIDWRNWDVYVPQFACRCAHAAKAKNFTYFGMQFYGECWSGQNGESTYFRDGPSSSCVDKCYAPCNQYRKFCSGMHFANFVYRLKPKGKEEDCEVSITPIGCYNENPKHPALPKVFYNEAEPGKPNFAGSLLQWSNYFKADFKTLLCKCAHLARSNKWGYFGVREIGLCVSNPSNPSNYDKYGASDKCTAGPHTYACPVLNGICGASDDSANYIYRVDGLVNNDNPLSDSLPSRVRASKLKRSFQIKKFAKAEAPKEDPITQE